MRRKLFRDIAAAPRDGTLIRLRLRDGTDFVGQFSDKYFGWVALHEIESPLIRGDIAFTGWAPIAEAEAQEIRRAWLIQPVQRAKRTSIVVVPPPVESPAVGSRIVKARKPRPRR